MTTNRTPATHSPFNPAISIAPATHFVGPSPVMNAQQQSQQHTPLPGVVSPLSPRHMHNAATTNIDSKSANAATGQPQKKKADPLREGTEFMGYIVGHVLGAGAGGMVRVATNPGTGAQVAIKVMPKASPKSKHHLRSMERESQIHQHLQHPHIVPMLEMFEDDEYIYIATEYMSGGTFLEWIRSKPLQQEVRARAFFLFYQIISALRFCQACRVVHRDVKPENMLMSKDGYTLKIADFGLAHVFPDAENAKMRTSCGSPYYCAPEVMMGKPYDPRKVDVWGAGVVFHALMIGSVPFFKPDVNETMQLITTQDWVVPPKCDSRCRDLLQRMLTRDPEQRISLDEVMQHPHWKKMCQSYGLNPAGDHEGSSGRILWREDKLLWNSGDAQVRAGQSIDESFFDAQEDEDDCERSTSGASFTRSPSEHLGDGYERAFSGSGFPSCDEYASGNAMRFTTYRFHPSTSRPMGLRALRGINNSAQSLGYTASSNSTSTAFGPSLTPIGSPPSTAAASVGVPGLVSSLGDTSDSCGVRRSSRASQGEKKMGAFSRLLNFFKPKQSKRGGGSKKRNRVAPSPSTVVKVKSSEERN